MPALDRVRSVQIDASGYADAYREDPKAADDFKKGQQSKWIERAEAGPKRAEFDVALDDFVRNDTTECPPFIGSFAGIGKKASKAGQPPEIRNSRSKDAS